MGTQTIQPVVPERIVVIEPVPHRGERAGHQLVVPLSPDLPMGHNSGFAQLFELLRHGWLRDAKDLGKLANRARGWTDKVNDPASGRVCDSAEWVGHLPIW